MSGSMTTRDLNEALGIPKPKYEGLRVIIDELEGKEIIFKDFSELLDTRYGSNGSYLRIEADIMDAGTQKAVTFNSSARDVVHKLKKAKAMNVLPAKATLRKVSKKDGPGYYWMLESQAE